MPGTYPTRPLVFLIADSIINQAGGKMTIIGAFAAGQILVPPGTTFPATLPLAVYAVFNDGEGTFKVLVRISGPDGKTVIETPPIADSTTKTPGQPLQVAVIFNMFSFPVPGTYKVSIVFDDHVYTNDISIRVSDKPIA